MSVFPQPAQFASWKEWASALIVTLRRAEATGEEEEVAVTRRLHGPAQLGTSAATVYTVPAKHKIRLTGIWVSNPTAGAVTLTLSIGADAASKRLYDAFSLAAGTLERWEGEITLEENEIIQAFAGTATALVLVLSGEVERV